MLFSTFSAILINMPHVKLQVFPQYFAKYINACIVHIDFILFFVGQGLLDFALLAANISKLQDLFRRQKRDAVFYVLVSIICVSIVLQVIFWYLL
jgi:hypothetical protein